MHICEIFQRDCMTFSFEFFPPRTDEAWDDLFNRISEFESLAPSFVSVTYGAGGSTRERTHDLVMRLKQETSLLPVPHLTCVCQSSIDVGRILERYAEADVGNIMALRGDAPADLPNYDPSAEEFKHAADLVRFIRRFSERNASQTPPAGSLAGPGFGIGVAGFPEGHPATPNTLKDMDHLKAKVDAGADYICTQMFFDNRVFYDWCDRCELAGIKVPLIAGIMPITSLKGMQRMAELSGGTTFPAALQRMIYRCQDDPDAVERVGIHWATEQCRDLIDRGRSGGPVRGIHFYTLNRSDATKHIYRTLGAKNSAMLR
jgi:methylenetetrahydrofolate reductase (NADPH)